MAHNGKAPKLNRARRGTPARGDWQKLEPLKEYVLEPLDTMDPPENCDGEWPTLAKIYWASWRESPVTARWTLDDVALAIDTIYQFAKTQRFIQGQEGVRLPQSEFRIRMENLGLTAKGRVDRRYLLPDEQPEAEVTPLHSVGVDIDSPAVPDRIIPEAI